MAKKKISPTNPMLTVQHNSNIRLVYCPICDGMFMESPLLKISIIKNPNLLWIANMVSHYRYRHIDSFIKKWGLPGARIRKRMIFKYRKEKRVVDERSKRQVIRQCRDYMVKNKIMYEDFLQLHHNEEETLLLAKKYLLSEITQIKLEL